MSASFANKSVPRPEKARLARLDATYFPTATSASTRDHMTCSFISSNRASTIVLIKQTKSMRVQCSCSLHASPVKSNAQEQPCCVVDDGQTFRYS